MLQTVGRRWQLTSKSKSTVLVVGSGSSLSSAAERGSSSGSGSGSSTACSSVVASRGGSGGGCSSWSAVGSSCRYSCQFDSKANEFHRNSRIFSRSRNIYVSVKEKSGHMNSRPVSNTVQTSAKYWLNISQGRTTMSALWQNCKLNSVTF